jgi:CRP/FNR family transcriptional regulator
MDLSLNDNELVGHCPKGHPVNECGHCKVRSVSVCSAVELAELNELDKLARHSKFEKRQNLFEEGEKNYFVYNITSGMVRLYKDSEDGRRQIVGFALPGDFIGLTMPEFHEFSCDALMDTDVCEFSRKGFIDLMASQPGLLGRLHSAVSHELTLAREHMVILGRRSAEEKICTFLLVLRRRFSRVDALTVRVPLPMNRQDISDYLGITLETVSRMLTKLERAEVIVIIPDGVRILDLIKLKALSGN